MCCSSKVVEFLLLPDGASRMCCPCVDFSIWLGEAGHKACQVRHRRMLPLPVAILQSVPHDSKENGNACGTLFFRVA